MSTPEGESVPEPTAAGDEELQRALADAVEAFGARVREHGELVAFPPGRSIGATDVAITTAAMLRAAEVYSFEIAAMFNI
jgi:hypothetical protein